MKLEKKTLQWSLKTPYPDPSNVNNIFGNKKNGYIFKI